MTIFLCGHGNWHLKDGFTVVPANTKVTFYTKNAKTLWIQEAYKVLNGTTQFTENDLDVYGPHSSVPDMTLSAVSAQQRSEFELHAKGRPGNWDQIFADPGHPKKLSTIMGLHTMQGNDLVWLACREVNFNRVLQGGNKLVGVQLGVNVRENPTTYYSAYIANRENTGAQINYVNKSSFRGFMPAGWNVPKK